MSKIKQFQQSRFRQRGVALLVVVALMLGMAMLAITLSVTSSTQFRLAANAQYENVAFNLAESAAATAENWLDTGTNRLHAGFDKYATATAQLYPLGEMKRQGIDPMTMEWTDANSVSSGAGSNARYVIEVIGRNKQALGSTVAVGGRPRAGCPKVDLFRVSARGVAAKSTSKIVQTTVALLLPDDTCSSAP